MRPTSWVYIFAIGIPLCYMLLLFMIHPELYFATLPEFIATIIGVMVSFAIARYAEFVHEQKQGKQWLKAIKKELEGIKGKLEGKGHLFYPDIWDSAILSGQIRLLNLEQITKLAEVYKFIKGTEYEAKQVRQASDDYGRAAAHSLEEASKLRERWDLFSKMHVKREAELRRMIDDLLAEKWWTE